MQKIYIFFFISNNSEICPHVTIRNIYVYIYIYFCHFNHLMIKWLHKYLIAVHYYFGNVMKYAVTFKTIHYKLIILIFSES